MQATSRDRAWAFVALLLFPQAALAGNWYVDGSLQVDAGYDDNPLLLSDGEEGVFGTTVTPSLTLGWYAPAATVGFDLALPYNAFSGDGVEGGGGDLDSFDQHAGSFMTLRSPLTELSLDARYDRDTTRLSELTDSGVLSGNERRERLAGKFSVRRRLTPVDTVSLNLGIQDVSYSTSALTDYMALDGNGEFRRNLDPRTEVGLALRLSRFDPESSSEGETHSVGLQALAAYAVSPTLDLEVAAGFSYVERERNRLVGGVTVSDSEDAIGGLFDIAIAWEMTPVDQLQLSYNRSLQPSATGILRTQDAIGVDYSRALTPKWSFSLSGRFLNQEAAAGSSSGAERQYFSVEPELSWQFLPQWSLSASYRLRWQDRDTTDTAVSNAFFLTLQYSAPRLKLY